MDKDKLSEAYKATQKTHGELYVSYGFALASKYWLSAFADNVIKAHENAKPTNSDLDTGSDDET